MATGPNTARQRIALAGFIGMLLWVLLSTGLAVTAQADPDPGGDDRRTSESRSPKPTESADDRSGSDDRTDRGTATTGSDDAKANRPTLRHIGPELRRGLTRAVEHATDRASRRITEVLERRSAQRPVPGLRTGVDRFRAPLRPTSTTDRELASPTPTEVRPVTERPLVAGTVTVELPTRTPAPTTASIPAAVRDTGTTVLTQVADRARELVSRIVATEKESAAAEIGRPLPQLRAAALTSFADTPKEATLVNVVGSAIFTVIGAAMQVLSGPALAPPGSTVSVRTSSLTMPETGQTVRADWYFPEEVNEDTKLIYLQHGFMATGPMYSYTAAYLAQETNSIVVAPTLSSNMFDLRDQWIGGAPMQRSVALLFAGDRAELTESAAAAGHSGDLPDQFVLVGHSLGGALVTGAAGRMTAGTGDEAVDGLRGVVLLDSVDLNGTVPAALDQLAGVPVYNIAAERYVWNMNGLVSDELTEARPGEFTGVMLVGGRHIDGALGGNILLQVAEYVVAGFSQPANVHAAQQIAAGWINDMFDENDTKEHGVYGTAEITTPTGSATAIALPLRSDESIQATPWDGLAEIILETVFGLSGNDLSRPAGTTVSV